MARLIHIVLLATAFACSVASRETQSQDSTQVESTTTLATRNSIGDVVAEIQTTEIVQDTARLVAVYDEQLAIATNDESRYYMVNVSVSQYEGSSTVTWHFDKDLAPTYFKESWSMEGQEGNNELIIKDGSVICAFSSDSQSDDKWCAQTGGVRSTWEEGETVAKVELLPPDYNTTSKTEFERELAVLVRILNEGKITSESPDSYIVRIESTIDVGQEVTESTEVDIPKVIYDELIR